MQIEKLEIINNLGGDEKRSLPERFIRVKDESITEVEQLNLEKIIPGDLVYLRANKKAFLCLPTSEELSDRKVFLIFYKYRLIKNTQEAAQSKSMCYTIDPDHKSRPVKNDYFVFKAKDNTYLNTIILKRGDVLYFDKTDYIEVVTGKDETGKYQTKKIFKHNYKDLGIEKVR